MFPDPFGVALCSLLRRVTRRFGLESESLLPVDPITRNRAGSREIARTRCSRDAGRCTAICAGLRRRRGHNLFRTAGGREVSPLLRLKSRHLSSRMSPPCDARRSTTRTSASAPRSSTSAAGGCRSATPAASSTSTARPARPSASSTSATWARSTSAAPRAAEAVQRLVTNDVGKLTDGARALHRRLPAHGRHRRRPHRLPDRGRALPDRRQRRQRREGPRLVQRERRPLVRRRRRLGRDGAHRLPGAGRQARAADADQGRRSASCARFDVRRRARRRRRCAASIARTGYTAEDGFEIFCAASDAAALWDRLLEAAAAIGGKPVGLGARDTLRLEGELSLYGNDLDRETTPLEAGLGWVVKLDGADFIGERAAARAEGGRRHAQARRLRDDRPRDRPPRLSALRRRSANDSRGERDDDLGRPRADAGEKHRHGLRAAPRWRSPATRISVDCRGKMVDAEMVKGPFYKRGKSMSAQ